MTAAHDRARFVGRCADEIGSRKFAELARKTVALIKRDAEPSTPDGWPAGTLGGGGGGLPSSSVESAVIARQKPPTDPVHLDVLTCLTIWRRIADDTQTLDRVLSSHLLNREESWCETHRAAGVPDVSSARRIEVDGRGWFVCDPCRDYYRRVGSLPTVAQVREHARSGRFGS